MCRALLAAMIGLVVLVSTNETARGESVNVSQEIANLQAQTDQLSKEIETLKRQVAGMEQMSKLIIRIPLPAPFHTDAAAIQISGIATAWVKVPTTSGPGLDITPIINFDLKNIGTTPITSINLMVSFYKPDKEVIGGGTLDLLDSNDAPLGTGMRQKVTLDYHSVGFPETRSAFALNADLYLQTDPGSYVLIDTCQISPSVEP